MTKRISAAFLLLSAVILFSLTTNGYCKTQENDNRPSGIGRNDSLVIDIVNIVRDEQKLDINRKRAVEVKMKNFPGKVIRRDTVTFFLQTALEIAYHEYVTGDKEAAKKRASNFLSNVQENNPLRIPLRYGLIKFTGLPSLELYGSQKKNLFLTSLLSELPLNLEIYTYRHLFYTLKDLSTPLSFLDTPIEINFIDKCKANNKTDILNCIAELWDISQINGPEDIETIEYELEDPVSTASRPLTTEEIKKDFSYSIFDAYGNLDVIDSLIRNNKTDSIGKYINNFQTLTFLRGELRPLIENSKKYENFIPVPGRMKFYNIWGISHSYLGEHEDAVRLYNKALKNVKEKLDEAVIEINIALSLCELGDFEEALIKIKNYEDIFNQSGYRFKYLDALGFVVSHIDKEEALKIYEEADLLLEKNINNARFNVDYNWPEFMTRHFIREANLYDHDLFKWRKALRLAKNHSGVDSYFNFFKGIPCGLYFSELGRFKSFLFDPVGARMNFDKADEIFSGLDPSDFRVEWLNKCKEDIIRYTPSEDTPEMLVHLLESKKLSALHNIWLCFNLAYQIFQGHDLGINILNNFLIENYTEALVALSGSESKFLTGPIRMIQEILMTDKILATETENLANLNLLRKGLTQSSKALIEKNLAIYHPEQHKGLVKFRKDLNSAYAYEDSLKVRNLLPQILQKESELYHAVKDSIDLVQFFGTNVNSISDHLSQNEVAIDFVCFQKNDTIQTGAFIIQKDIPTKFIRLKNILDFENNLSLEDISDIWVPLQQFIENKEHIYFSPDGLLLNLGIEFLPSLNGSPLINDYKIHRVSHLREIKNGEIDIDGEIALIGVSDHNSPIGEGETIYRGNWIDMPGVKNEIEALDLILNNYPHSVYFNDTATEADINDLNGNNISVLHFSTHGIYLDFNALTHSIKDPSHFDHNIARRILNTDRQSICGLVLRGGNISWKIPHILDENDDILMDDEIENMNFPNLKLTVLSACNSALGEIDSDGIQGLQRAFRIAGAKNIICSLKKVDDYWTEQFMILLYQNLTNGFSIYDSFRNTQKRLYEKEPDKKDIWSSFILIE